MEAALAHAVRNKAEAAYARSDLFEKRRALMESWSEYLAARVRGRRSDLVPTTVAVPARW